MSWINKNVAAPGLYEAESSFVLNTPLLSSRKKGVSIPLTPRQELFKDQTKRVSPGPAVYAVHDDAPKGKAATMGLLLKRYRDNLPGTDPGKYQPIEAVSPRGDYFLSKFTNSRCMKMPSAQRFNYKYEEQPAPATWNFDLIQTENAEVTLVIVPVPSTNRQGLNQIPNKSPDPASSKN